MLNAAGTKAPRRRTANYEDEEELCHICDELFNRGQPIIWTVASNPKPVHKYRCKNRYYAALVLYYNLTALDLVSKFNLGTHTAYRIQALARSL